MFSYAYKISMERANKNKISSLNDKISACRVLIVKLNFTLEQASIILGLNKVIDKKMLEILILNKNK